MVYNFKSIADVDVVDKPTDTASILLEDNGIIKKAPMAAVGGSGMCGLSIVYDNDNDYNILYASEDLYGTLVEAMNSYQIPNVTLYSVSNNDNGIDIYATCAYRIRCYPEYDGYINAEFGAFAANIYSDGRIEVFYND